MVRAAILSGSTRPGSYNMALARLAAVQAEAAGAEVVPIDLAAFDLPLYTHARELADYPPDALRLKTLLCDSDALIVATPEHNGSISTLLKNAIDWASRPTGDEGVLALSAFRGKTAAIMAASTGPFGGLRALTHLRQILGTVQAIVIPEQLCVPIADQAFDGDGALREDLPSAILTAMVARVVDVAARLAR